MYIYASIFFVKVPFLENNLYKSDAVSRQKEDIFIEDWSEFILCDWNQLLGSKVSHIDETSLKKESGKENRKNLKPLKELFSSCYKLYYWKKFFHRWVMLLSNKIFPKNLFDCFLDEKWPKMVILGHEIWSVLREKFSDKI